MYDNVGCLHLYYKNTSWEVLSLALRRETLGRVFIKQAYLTKAWVFVCVCYIFASDYLRQKMYKPVFA